MLRSGASFKTVLRFSTRPSGQGIYELLFGSGQWLPEQVQLRALPAPAGKHSSTQPLQRVPPGVAGMLSTFARNQTAGARLEAGKTQRTPPLR